MSDPILIFETKPSMGTPCIKAVNGAAKMWSQRDLELLENQLRSRYDGLVRQGSGTIEFKGQTLYVKRQEGDTSRQPTLELRMEEVAQYQLPIPVRAPLPLPVPDAPTADWFAGLLAELDRLFNSEEFNVILPAEKMMLKVVAEELASLRTKSQLPEMSLVLLTSILMTADHLSRTQQPSKATYYAIALNGIESLLKDTDRKQTIPWGHLPSTPNSEPVPSWLSRWLSKLTGT